MPVSLIFIQSPVKGLENFKEPGHFFRALSPGQVLLDRSETLADNERVFQILVLGEDDLGEPGVGFDPAEIMLVRQSQKQVLEQDVFQEFRVARLIFRQGLGVIKAIDEVGQEDEADVDPEAVPVKLGVDFALQVLGEEPVAAKDERGFEQVGGFLGLDFLGELRLEGLPGAGEPEIGFAVAHFLQL